MPISVKTYERVALEDPDGFWELHDGCLVQKPEDLMTVEHNRSLHLLAVQLYHQIDDKLYEVRINSGRARRLTESFYIPDLIVVPVSLVQELLVRPGSLEVYAQPLPFVVEVWSRSTGRYDVDAKLPVYQQRGDAEIWRVHPYDQTVTKWQRQGDGTYRETQHREGTVALSALPDVVIDIDRLFT